jgi:hypothetical protein
MVFQQYYPQVAIDFKDFLSLIGVGEKNSKSLSLNQRVKILKNITGQEKLTAEQSLFSFKKWVQCYLKS